jgi:hypothetical protein
MKQLALVLLIAITSLSVSAQKDYRSNNRNRDKYDRVERYDDKKSNRFARREKEEYRRQLERINHDYDSKIRSVARNPWVGRKNKARKMDQLERERRHALNECRARFHRQMDYVERGKNNRRNKW